MRAEILKPTDEAIEKAASIILGGGLVAFPTETVYGLGADALNGSAVAKIFEVKERPRFDPIIVHIGDPEDLEDLCVEIDERAKLLIEKFWPGPLTLVLPKSPIVPEIVTAGLGCVAVRMPSHEVALRFIKRAKTPVAAPSANPFGYLSPTTASHVAEGIGERVDLIIDGGRCPVGVESTVLELIQEPTILRIGGLPIEEIERVIGRVRVLTLSERPHSPGQLPRHYSPKTPLRLIKEKGLKVSSDKRAGLLAFRTPMNERGFERVETLSRRGDLREAASNLFSCLHRLDRSGLDIIYAEPVPEVGLGRAIMERLRKAEGMKRG